ncbi:MAG: hypothetical protein Q8O89_03495 [Nanoarchaeota archaeon]|nr:hypothetical protein [Nanoarchaeota archaeon]
MAETITRNYCMDCSKKQDSCCCAREFYYPLTIDEIKKAVAKGFKMEDFATVEDVSGALNNESEWYKKGAVDVNGKEYFIVTKQKGDYCCFLENEKGCILGNDRPAVCKMFPLWVDDDENLTYEIDFCHIVKDSKLDKSKKDLKKLLKAVNETEENLREYKKSLCEDFTKNKTLRKELVFNLLKLK